MTLADAIESYIVLKRSLGAQFSGEGRILRSFLRTVGNVEVGTIPSRVTAEFCSGSGEPSLYSTKKYYTLRGLFTYLVSRGHLSCTPLADEAPRVSRSFEAHIYTHEELRRLLDATEILADCRSRLQHKTFRTLLLTLYGAGLRPGEGLRLRCCDVDLDDRVLTIKDTKFFKSRFVPVGESLSAALRRYSLERRSLPMPSGASSAFFATRTGKHIAMGRLEKVFSRLRIHSGVSGKPGDRWHPRLHDLRHTFAVDRLVAWYREGADIQACLVLLSTYLGHAHISGTQHYLSMTPELLSAASSRFERYAAIAAVEDQHG